MTKPELIELIRLSDAINRELFQQVVSSATQFIEEETLIRELKISAATLTRWTDGDSLPHPLGRAPVFSVIKELLEV